VKRYQQRLYWAIRRLVYVHEDADDILQETFIRVWKGLPSFNAQSSLYTWMYRIAINEALAFLRKQKWKNIFQLRDPQEILQQRLQASIHEGADEILIQLHEAISTLPPQQRAVFNLRYFEHMPFKQIAEVMGRTESTVKVHYHLARKKIEEFLKTH